MLPDSWKIKTIGEIAEVSGGKRLPKGYQLTDKNTGFPYIRVTDMYDGGVDVSSVMFVPSGIASKISRYCITKDDIFITVAGTLGLIGEVPQALCGANLTENADKLTNLKCNKGFLLEVLRSPIVQKPIEEEKTQNAQPKLALSRIREFLIPIPPLPEQKKIAQILSTWNDTISANEDLLANSRLRKKALMQQLLTGKKRLPGFSGEWRLAPIGSLFVERNETGADEMPLIGIGEIGIYLASDSGRKDNSSSDKGKYKVIRPGDIGYNTMRMWQGRCGLSSLTGIVSPAYTVITPTKSAEATFFSYLFKAPEYIHKFYSSSQGLVSDTWSLKYKEFSKIKVLSPEVNEQKAISDILTTADDEIEALEQRINNLKLQKKALMQQLLTGKKRVKVEPVTA